MTTLAPLPIFQGLGPNGQALAGGFLYTYAAGTTTPQATYTDSTGSTPNTNPVVLNSFGQAAVWLDPTLSYKFILKDTLGNQIWATDNIQGAIAGTGSIIPIANNTYDVGSATYAWRNGYFGTQAYIGTTPVLNSGAVSYWPQTTAESGASLIPVNYAYPSDVATARARRYSSTNTWDYRNDQRLFEIYLSKYGAVFNGTTDDGPAISDAINAMFALVGSAGPRRVIMPSGGLTAKINSGFTVYCGALGIDFNGMVIDATSIAIGSVITGTGRGSAPYSRYASSAPIENFNLLGSTVVTNTPTMLYLDGGTPQAGEISNGFFRNFSIYGGSVGIDFISNVYVCSFFNAFIGAQTQYGVRFTGGTNTGENINFHGGQIEGVQNPSFTGVGLYLTTGAADTDFNIFGMSIDYCDKLVNLQSGKLTLNTCHLESKDYGTGGPFISLAQAAATGYHAAFRMYGGNLYIASGGSLTHVIDITSGNQLDVDLHFNVENGSSIPAQLVKITDSSTPRINVGATLQYWAAPSIYGPLNSTYNGDFELGTLAGWTTNGTGYTWSASTTTPHSGTYDMSCVSTSANTGTATQMIPVRGGQQIYTDMFTNVTALSAGTFGTQIRFFQDSAGANQIGTGFTAATYSATTSGWTESEASGVVPAGANYMQIQVVGTSFTGTAYVDDIKVAIV